ncbi:MAG: hypothetical protein ACE5LX_04875, partial [Nitrospinota bacterium]
MARETLKPHEAIPLPVPALGVVMPVWFNPRLPLRTIGERLRLTLSGTELYIGQGKLVVVVDGDARSLRVLKELLKEGVGPPEGHQRLIHLRRNRGKGRALVEGLKALLPQKDLHFFAFRDGDGDHYLNDLMNLYRYALWMREKGANDDLIVIGRRAHIGRSVGMARADFEVILSRVTLEALKFHLARKGRALDLRFLSGYEEVPDLMSGYKIVSRSLAELIVRRDWQEVLPKRTIDLYRYGMELIPLVEGATRGGLLGEVQRRVGEERGLSGHGRFADPRVNAGLALWLFLRL